MEKAFLSPRLCGGRFKDGGIPLDVLPDLLALQDLVNDIARSEYLNEHPSERHVPPGFSENLKLRLTAIKPGSAVAEISFDDSTPRLPAVESRYETYALRAADTIHDVIDAGHNDRALPTGLPKGFRKHFAKFGHSLQGDETIEFDSPGRLQPATLTPRSRENLIERLRVQDECELVTFRGRVPELDHDRRKFEFWPIGGSKISVSILDSHRDILIQAFNGFWDEAKIALTGQGIVKGDGKLMSLESIQDVKLLDPLDVDAQLDDLSTLRDGWLNGDGVALDRSGLKWFSTKFADLYPAGLPLPYLYPTPEGGVQAEWSFHGCRMDLEVDLRTHGGEWDETGPGDHGFAMELDLDNHNDWERLGERLRTMTGSHS